MSKRDQALRLGFIAAYDHPDKYLYEMAVWANCTAQFDFIYLLKTERPDHLLDIHNQRLLHAIKECFRASLRMGLSFIKALEAKLLRLYPTQRDHYTLYPLKDIYSLIETGKVRQDADGQIQLAGETIERIKAKSLDLLIYIGNGNDAAAVSQCAKQGVFLLHYTNPDTIPLDPPGFWEVYNRLDTSTFTIKYLPPGTNYGLTIRSGKTPTQFFFLLNQAILFSKAFYYLKLEISSYLKQAVDVKKASPSAPIDQRPRIQPSTFQQIDYIFNLGLQLMNRVAHRFLCINNRSEWQIAYIETDWHSAELWRGTRIHNPKGGYLADPFVIRREDTNYAFVEEFDSIRNKGHISAYKLTNKSAERLGTVIDETFHLSFPYLFEHQGQLYMCPESNANKDIRVYKCDEFPLSWSLAKVIMRDIAAVDSMIFPHNGKWWLFSNMDPGKTGDNHSELYIFQADTPLTIEWQAHPMNPIYINPEKARNAGLLVDDEKIYRISQRHSFSGYGKDTSINLITTLSESAFEELSIGNVTPSFFPKISRTHHLHSSGGVTAFDFFGPRI